MPRDGLDDHRLRESSELLAEALKISRALLECAGSVTADRLSDMVQKRGKLLSQITSLNSVDPGPSESQNSDFPEFVRFSAMAAELKNNDDILIQVVSARKVVTAENLQKTRNHLKLQAYRK